MSVRLSSLVDLVRGLGVSCATEPGSRPQIRDPQITDVVSDSRMVRPGSLFCCIRGEKNDGHDYVPMALERGAAALLCERPVASVLPAVVVPSVRQVMGETEGKCDDEIEVLLPLGLLHIIKNSNGEIFMRGPAAKIADGVYEEE